MTDTDQGRTIARRVVASRRGLMCAAAGLGAAGALAACGTAEPTSDPDGGSGDQQPTEGEGGATPLAATSDVPVGGGIVVSDIVIVQPTADEFLAFSALCPHQGTVVGAPDAEGVITCPNHNSQFDMEGELLQGPAETGLTEVDITVEDGSVFAA